MNMIVGSAEKPQAKEITELLRYISEFHKNGRPDVFLSGLPKYSEDEVCGLIDDENTVILTAVDENKVKGYLIAKIITKEKSRHMAGGKVFFIDDLCVGKQFSHQGIGTALLEEAKKAAAEKGCEKIELNVWAFNEGAIEFYKKAGLSVSRMYMEYIL